jgi:enoyl-CoA hydratase
MNINTDWQNGHLALTIQREEALNALNSTVLSELKDVIHKHPQARVITITGAGSKAFVAGADLAEMRSMSAQEAQEFATKGHALSLLMENHPGVFIAAVNGYALGGGCELALACDVIVAADTAQFALPEVGLGLIPGFGGTQRLIHRVGVSLCMDMTLCGRKLNGIEAVQAGLAAEHAPIDQFKDLVDKRVKNILKSAPQAIAAAKALARKAIHTPIVTGLDHEAIAFGECFKREESKEGITAFFEKRRANFC